ncbi:hypothetical protein [Azospirillum sp.]|uniref:hypothetical protein n=1 Tax=Azospirillum sp. TaxID=34012 RepID=UPI003D75E880
MNEQHTGVALRLALSDASQLAAVLVLAVELAPTLEDLVDWWREPRHQRAMQVLSPADLDRVVTAKDRRKAELAFRS